jgi:hypothetical protein
MTTALSLSWLDPTSVARIRKQAAWRALLDEALAASDAPSLPGQKASAEDRRDVLAILARAAAMNAEEVDELTRGAVRDDGKFAPPLLITSGELRLPFEETEVLKGMVTTATPFAVGDEPLDAAVRTAEDFLGTPGLPTAPAVVEALAGRIRDAFARVKRAVPPSYLDAQTERALLLQRRYQKRMFDGDPHLRALIQGPNDSAAMLAYLPVSAADHLPLFQRFPARVIAEGHLAADQYETQPFALRVVALAREIPPPPAKR